MIVPVECVSLDPVHKVSKDEQALIDDNKEDKFYGNKRCEEGVKKLNLALDAPVEAHRVKQEAEHEWDKKYNKNYNDDRYKEEQVKDEKERVDRRVAGEEIDKYNRYKYQTKELSREYDLNDLKSFRKQSLMCKGDNDARIQSTGSLVRFDSEDYDGHKRREEGVKKLNLALDAPVEAHRVKQEAEHEWDKKYNKNYNDDRYKEEQVKDEKERVDRIVAGDEIDKYNRYKYQTKELSREYDLNDPKSLRKQSLMCTGDNDPRIQSTGSLLRFDSEDYDGHKRRQEDVKLNLALDAQVEEHRVRKAAENESDKKYKIYFDDRYKKEQVEDEKERVDRRFAAEEVAKYNRHMYQTQELSHEYDLNDSKSLRKQSLMCKGDNDARIQSKGSLLRFDSEDYDGHKRRQEDVKFNLAIDSLVEAHRVRKAAENESNKQYKIYYDDRYKEEQVKDEKERVDKRFAAEEVDKYRHMYQTKELSREYDLNDPQSLRKQSLMCAGDDDPRIQSKGSLLRFDSEDYDGHKRRQEGVNLNHALDAQVEAHRVKNEAEYEWDKKYKIYNDDRYKEEQVKDEKERVDRRFAAEEIDKYRHMYQTKELSREYDLNDPQSLRKQSLMCTGDNDPRIQSTGSLLRFDSEDYDGHKRRQEGVKLNLALDAQVEAHRVKNEAENGSDNKYKIYNDDRYKEEQVKDEKERVDRRFAAEEIDKYRHMYQTKELSREYDLNDPQSLRKQLPMCTGDDDPRIQSKGSLLRFDSEDYDGQRKRTEGNKLRLGLEEQIRDKVELKAREKLADKNWGTKSVVIEDGINLKIKEKDKNRSECMRNTYLSM